MLRFSRWYLFKGLAAILCIVGISWLALDYFIPAPPLKISIATAFKGGAYEFFGHKYQEILARAHIELDVRLTDGSAQNLKLLQDPNSGVQVAFVQGGVSNGKQEPGVLSLGRINYQLFCVFYRSTETVDDLTMLKGKRIAVGPVGSGTQVVAAEVLRVSGITPETATLLPLFGLAAVKALKDSTADVIFYAGASDAPIIQSLFRDPDVRLMNFALAETYTRIFPYLIRLVLPRGVIDIARKIPPTDVNLIGTTNAIIVRSDLHPELIGLLTQALLETHSGAEIFQRVGEFPSQTDPEYPVAENARDYYKNGPSFLHRYLPFWAANYARRMIAVLVAGIAIFLPLFNYVPKAYLWLVRENMSKLYRRLRIIEKGLQTELTVPQVASFQNDLEKIDKSASLLRVPTRHSALLFGIKVHIDLIRTRLAARLAEVRSKTAKAA
jgi:TRAP transporter TAXI family solute receptor